MINSYARILVLYTNMVTVCEWVSVYSTFLFFSVINISTGIYRIYFYRCRIWEDLTNYSIMKLSILRCSSSCSSSTKILSILYSFSISSSILTWDGWLWSMDKPLWAELTCRFSGIVFYTIISRGIIFSMIFYTITYLSIIL